MIFKGMRMKKIESNLTKAEHLEMSRKAWDAYHPHYTSFKLRKRPNFHQFFADGGVELNDVEIKLAGDIKGKKLLDICCTGDATQAFSWENLGAEVVACDFSPVAIELAKRNAEKIGSRIEFKVADAQILTPIADNGFDIVYATYTCWLEDLYQAAQTWHRVLKPGGRLLLFTNHPVAGCLEETDCALTVIRDYFDDSPEYYNFTGTPIADEYGGWDGKLPIVEFVHPLADVINAIAGAGLCIKQVVETRVSDEQSPLLSQLPKYMAWMAKKEDS
jgi:SAM-dependent methyltransferase